MRALFKENDKVERKGEFHNEWWSYHKTKNPLWTVAWDEDKEGDENERTVKIFQGKRFAVVYTNTLELSKPK